MTRNEFLMWLGGSALLVACGGGGEDKPADAASVPGCKVSDASIEIVLNHVHNPHVMVVSIAEVAAAAEKTYDIEGTAGHTHLVTLTAAHFATLAGGGMVSVISTDGLGHTHEVKVSCA